MRLIDADELLKDKTSNAYVSRFEIENAPTIQTEKPIYKIHYSSITLEYWKDRHTACYALNDVTVYSDNIEKADEKCFDLVKFKLVDGCGYEFKANVESICEVIMNDIK